MINLITPQPELSHYNIQRMIPYDLYRYCIFLSNCTIKHYNTEYANPTGHPTIRDLNLLDC